MPVSHDMVVEAVKAYNPSLSYRERQLLDQRDYPGLLELLNRSVRDAKWMIVAWPVVALIQVVLHGYNIMGGLADGGDLARALRSAVILLAAWFLLGMGAAWVGVTRLASLERAKFVLELAVEQAAARATPEPLEPFAPAGAAALAANRCLGADKSKTETNFLENERFSAGGWILAAGFV